MPTAYEESLKLAAETGDLSSTPSYITAADTLNTANGNQSFLDSAFDVAESVPKFITVSLISGANQIYNIPADVGNLLGGDFERSDTNDVVTALDSDLGQFYKEHKEGADLVGFLASSMIPGTAGVKVVQAGQKSLRAAITGGKFGENMGRALGLLAPQKAKWVDAAMKEALTNSSAASAVSTKAMRGVMAGMGQNAIEALAFETAVTATMFNSPILENQDLGDFVDNVAWGAGVFGLIGGAVDAAKIGYKLKNAADSAAIDARPWTFIPEQAKASSTYEKLALDFDTLHKMPEVPTNLGPDRVEFLRQSARATSDKLENRIRGNLGELAKGDQAVADTLFQTFKGTSKETKQSAFVGAMDATRMGVTGKFGKSIEQLERKVISGKASIEEIEKLADSKLVTSYVKAWGEDVGRVTSDAPIITSLVDTLKKGESITVLKRHQGVKAGSKVHKFNIRYNKGKEIGTKALANITSKAGVMDANARYIWASKLPKFEPTAKSPIAVHVEDIPLMEKVLTDVTNPADLQHVTFTGLAKGETVGADLGQFIAAKKIEVANKLLQRKGKNALSQDEIAAIVNVKSSALGGELVQDSVKEYSMKDMLAMQDHAEEYTQKLVKQGLRRESDGPVDIWNIPQHVKLTYDTSPFNGINNFVLENMAVIKQQQKLYQESSSRASASVLGEDFAKFESIGSDRIYQGAKPSGAGAGYLTAASHNYGSLAGSAENIGRVTAGVIEKFKERTRTALDPLLYKLANNQKAAIEWSALNAKVRSIEGQYGLNEAGDALEPLAMLRYKAAVKEAQAIEGAPLPKEPRITIAPEDMVIPIKNAETRELMKAHIELNAKRTNGLAELRTAQGYQFNRSPDVFYPIPVNPSDYPHFAMVIDNSITSGNHSKTLYANSADELSSMIAKLKQNPQLKVLTKTEAEDYYRARGQWDYEKTLSDNYLDIEAHRKGVSAPYLPSTDPAKITKDMLDWHMQRESGLVREAVTAKYEVQFEELKRLGDDYTNVSTSRFGNINLRKFSGDASANPYRDYIKTALAVKKTADYPWWSNFNKMVDEKFSTLYNKITGIRNTARSETELNQINTALEEAGYTGAKYDESMDIFANAEAPRGVLSGVVQKANALMATVVLRWDALNAVNNAVSANVLLGAETKAVIRAISRGDDEAVGALAALTRIKVPGTQDTIFAAEKLIGNAIKKFNRSGEDFRFYKENGFMTSISSQYVEALDDLTYKGAKAESVQDWNGRINRRWDKLKKAGDFGEKYTGNKLAEEFNRFVAADVMKQMTDVAVQRNLMTEQAQLAYINTFVNRTQGNYLAAQRPMMFHGAVGQAIGLFQTYQFNLLQQMLRHVGEGHSKDAMTLLGLQGTIHGMNGLPAFNAINTNLIGNASGNKEHRDAYDAVYGTVGKEAGDWLTYGVASNALGLLDPSLKVNLYARGDINPRHVTVVPTNPSSVPIIQASAKVYSNIATTAKRLAQGGDTWNTILQGLEHNGLSRPLAGLAQTLQGFGNPEQASYSTSKRGNVIAANDLLSLANIARMAGGKPLDEAIAIDATYRYKSYALKDSRKRQLLGQAIKSTMQAGEDPTQEQINEFITRYVESGGKQQDFNKWFTQLYKTANLSQSNKIQRSLTDPFAQSMQTLMGGEELRDFSQP